MTVARSKPVEIDGKKYSFGFEDGKLLSVVEVSASGTQTAVDLNSEIFTSEDARESIVNAFNQTVKKGDTNSYVEFDEDKSITDLVTFASIEERRVELSRNQKKFNNEAATMVEYTSGKDSNTAPKKEYYTDKTFFPGYVVEEEKPTQVFAYPLDISLEQDHMKITKFKYVRADINLSKPDRVEKIKFERVNVAGDSMIGNELMGSIFLPMPKPTDVNAAAWGKSELNSAGLLALGAAAGTDRVGGLFGLLPRNSQITVEQQKQIDEAKKAQARGDLTTGAFLGPGSSTFNQINTGLASFLTGQEIDQDTFLARTGGHVLNPNAEMLFQGPSIRDFSFTFTMIARSQKEGKEIRNLIRFLKLGLAPKFRNTTYLANPDVFTLEYKRGKTEHLKTVNRFNPGGLALTRLAVDYAPDGYWAAYRDSQPVAVKMDLNFTELRPIYEQDQMKPILEDSVGY